MKNGTSFSVVVARAGVLDGVWDPHQFSHRTAPGEPLSAFATASKPGGGKAAAASPWVPVEYRHVPVGGGFAFRLEPAGPDAARGSVPGGSILLGTMRAYLGNILVTPEPDWIGAPKGSTFAVKSEFLLVQPFDGFVYYWAAYLQSEKFLRLLPPGGGGTRPRLPASDLLRVPVQPAPTAEREALNDALRDLARREWQLVAERTALLPRVVLG